MQFKIQIMGVLFLIIGFYSSHLVAKPTSIQQDLHILKHGIETIHPGYKRYTTDQQRKAMWEHINTVLTNDSPLAQVYLEISRLTALLRCDHTIAEFPKALEEQKKQRFLPFQFRIFDKKMYVESVQNELSLKKGDEIIRINNIEIDEIINKLSPLMPRDGYTDHTAVSSIENNFNLLGSGFEQFFALEVLKLNQFPKEYSLQIKSLKTGTISTQKVHTISFDDWLALYGGSYRLDFKDAIDLKFKDNYAVLKIDTFVNYRNPINAKSVFKKIFKQLKQKHVSHLIVDLRNNGGGSDDVQLALMKFLYNSPFQLNDAAWFTYSELGDLKQYINTWQKDILSPDVSQLNKEANGYRVKNKDMGENYLIQKPAKMAFDGEIIMLTSRHNSSASAALLAHIKHQENVTLVGESTGGNQGGTNGTVMLFLKLPHTGISVRIPVFRNSYTIPNKQDGLGAQPDISVIEDFNSWINERDKIMNKAIELTKTK
ncbi:MAG: S41 family peptidase [Marinicellaceae bacterium]